MSNPMSGTEDYNPKRYSKAHPKFIAGMAKRGLRPITDEHVYTAKKLRRIGFTYKKIAKIMKRAPSTVWRMVNR